MLGKISRARREGFTIIELLIVISILALLAAVVVAFLNPVETLKQPRDAVRIVEIDGIVKAVDLYQAENPDASLGIPLTVYVSIPDPNIISPATTSTCPSLGLPQLSPGWNYYCVTSANLRRVDGDGWIPLNLVSLPSGVPFHALPIDPINSSEFYYAYIPGYIATARMESEKYQPAVAPKDGGADALRLERGSDLTLWGDAVLRQVDLAWDPSTDNVGVTGYRVFRSTVSGGPYTEIGTSPNTTYSDSTVVSGVAYYYVVRAYDAAFNTSDPSNETSATVP